MAFPGTYFDGSNPERHSVLVTLTGEGLAIARPDGAPLAFWRFAVVARSEGEGDGATTRLCRGEARLRIEGADFARALRAVDPALAPRSPRRRLLRTAALVALTASAALSLYLLLPRLDAPLAALVPPSWEARLGARTIQLLGGRRCIDPAGEAALGRLAARLTAGVTLPAPLRVEVSDRKEINAFTVPGGRIVLFDGLLKAAASA